MNQAVKDGIGQGRVTDGFTPVFEWKLAGNQGRCIDILNAIVTRHFDSAPPEVGDCGPWSQHATQLAGSAAGEDVGALRGSNELAILALLRV
jgi:hypothetical protein